jgi:hypothetical protein
MELEQLDFFHSLLFNSKSKEQLKLGIAQVLHI